MPIDNKLKIKRLCDSLASIEIQVNEEGVVQILPNVLSQWVFSFRTTTITQDTPPTFHSPNYGGNFSVKKTDKGIRKMTRE